MSKNQSKSSIPARCQILRKQLYSLNSKELAFQKAKELQSSLDQDQQICFTISDQTKDFIGDVIDQRVAAIHPRLQQSEQVFSQNLGSLNSSTQIQVDSISSISAMLKQSGNEDHKERAEQIFRQLIRLESERGALESQLKEIQNDIEMTKGIFESLNNIEKLLESQKYTASSKANEAINPSAQLKEELTHQLLKNTKEEHKIPLNKTKSVENYMDKELLTQNLNLIIVFEQTGRPIILQAREYIEVLLNQFVQKVNPIRTFLVTFDDKVFKAKKLMNNKVIIPSLEKTGMWGFKDYNKNKPNYAQATEGILSLLKKEQQTQIKTVSLLVSQGLKKQIILANAEQIQQCDPRHKLFMLCLSSQQGYNVEFWEKFSSDINGSYQNDKTKQDFYELVRDQTQVEEALLKFERAVSLEKVATLQTTRNTVRKEIIQSIGAQEQIIRDKIQATIANSQVVAKIYTQKSQKEGIQKALSKIESKQASLIQQIEETLASSKQQRDNEQSIQNKIQEIANEIAQQTERYNVSQQIIRSLPALSSEEKYLLEQLLKEINEYLIAKTEISQCISGLMETISQAIVCHAGESMVKIIQNITIQMSDLQCLVD